MLLSGNQKNVGDYEYEFESESLIRLDLSNCLTDTESANEFVNAVIPNLNLPNLEAFKFDRNCLV